MTRPDQDITRLLKDLQDGRAEPATLTTRWLDEELTTRTFASSNVVKANLEQWADAAEGRGDYRFTDDQKLHNVEILEAIVRSAGSGDEVMVR